MNEQNKLWAIVPAAGIGQRVGGALPKQYLALQGKPIIEWTLNRLLQLDELEKIIVVISDNDEYWPNLGLSADSRIQTASGGTERCHSVLNGLLALQAFAEDSDWVMVHDAARPCVTIRDIRHLIDTAISANQGAILGMPVRDTVKKSNNINEIEDTVNRDSLWHAFTPQLFKYGDLRQALESALADGFQVTDESSAMEYAGFQPLLVEGASDNIKVTVASDLALADFFITTQDESAC